MAAAGGPAGQERGVRRPDRRRTGPVRPGGLQPAAGSDRYIGPRAHRAAGAVGTARPASDAQSGARRLDRHPGHHCRRSAVGPDGGAGTRPAGTGGGRRRAGRPRLHRGGTRAVRARRVRAGGDRVSGAGSAAGDRYRHGGEVDAALRTGPAHGGRPAHGRGRPGRPPRSGGRRPGGPRRFTSREEAVERAAREAGRPTA